MSLRGSDPPDMKALVAQLCSERCAGRAAGSKGGVIARSMVIDALRAAGLDPHTQAVPACGGANVIATLPGDVDRWVLVAAHYDHLGSFGGETYYGADDNAAAVAILVELARRLVDLPQTGRSVLIVSFDAEEPPHFLSESMGSQHYVNHPVVELSKTDMMVCMDLVGHALGPPEAPASVRQTLFALGAERSEGTAALVDGVAAVDGVIVRRVDAEIIAPLSDYAAFWDAKVPFLFLSAARWRHYHTPQDTPEKLDYPKMLATAKWLERFVRDCCSRDEEVVRFRSWRDDRSTLETAVTLTDALAELNQQAALGSELARSLLEACDEQGQLPDDQRDGPTMLVGMLESGLA